MRLIGIRTGTGEYFSGWILTQRRAIVRNRDQRTEIGDQVQEDPHPRVLFALISDLRSLLPSGEVCLAFVERDDELEGGVRGRKADDFHIFQAGLAASGKDIVFRNVFLSLGINDPESGRS